MSQTFRYYPRTMQPCLQQAAEQFPVVLLTGPRQTGKSTLLRHQFPQHKYVSLDDPLLRTQAQQDPYLFFDSYPAPLMIDEIQYAPELLSYIKMQVDAHRRKQGQFILTGSQAFPLMQGVCESLAGRIALYELLGFSFQELPQPHAETFTVAETFEMLFRGFYPEVCVHAANPALFYRSYLQTYLERDVIQLRAVHDLALFQRFVELLFARVGQLLNVNELAKECGVNHSTAKQWLGLLEASRIVYLLKPFHKNLTKRVVKSPKVYITDTGLLCHTLRFSEAQVVQNSPLAGSVFENFVVMEWLKKKWNTDQNYELFFLRDSNHNEVDLILDQGEQRVAFEIKLTQTPQKNHAATLHKMQPSLNCRRAYLISHSPQQMKLYPQIELLPWWKMLQVDL